MKEVNKKIRKPVRTISGVTPLAVVLPPKKCDHGNCLYCPGGDHVPQSYTEKSPAVMRAMALEFDPSKQVENRLYVLNKMGHPTDKIEVIILGGTFLQYNLDYQYNFIKKIYDSLNGEESQDLESAKKLNETSKHRCVAMCVENRPDNCSKKEIERMLQFGVTRVEIGVQMPDDEIYKKTNRGHSVNDVIEATKRLKNAGFKLGYHIMPGQPYSNPKRDMELFKKIFDEDCFRPDQLKLYPCQIMKHSPLEKVYKKIGFKPYSEEETKDILVKMMLLVPEYCRVMRVVREFPKETLVEGLKRLDLRKSVEEALIESGKEISEIRMREVGFHKQDLDKKVRLKVTEYNSSDGKEYFIQFVNKDNFLFGLLRLRIYDDKAVIREVHVYGQAVKIGEKGEDSQHIGLGKLLIKEAEKIVKENKINELSIISGVGVREYYRKLGYYLDENKIYMIKSI